MHRLLRVLLSAPGLISAVVGVRGQSAERPSIFAPRMSERADRAAGISPAAAKPAPAERVAPTQLSERVRNLVKSASEQVLAQAEPFAFKPSAVSQDAEASASTSDSSAVVMSRYVVKSTALTREQAKRPELPWIQPTVLERDDRRVIKGYTFTFWRSRDGNKEVFFNLIDFAGQGIDHAKDFGRVELGFKMKF